MKKISLLHSIIIVLIFISTMSVAQSQLFPWTGKAPYPYVNEDSALVKDAYKGNWAESSIEKHSEAVIRAKEVLKEWGQNPDKYDYDGKSYVYKILFSESPDFISVNFTPVGVGLEGIERHFEIRMTKNGFKVVSIIPGSMKKL